MTIKQFCCGIGLAEEAYKNLNFEREYDGLSIEDINEKEALSYFVKKACDFYQEYQTKGISDQVYFDTFRDITIWSNDYYKKNGVWGIKEKKWLSLPFQFKLFRLGRLQYEPTVLTKDIIYNGKHIVEGTKVLDVHIPEDGALAPEECERSFQSAKKFFGPQYLYAVCTSWLLSPKLKEIMKTKSNIICFQNFFEVHSVIYTFPQAEERVFGVIEEDKTLYAEKTSLQREVKKLILAGIDIGMGSGIRVL